MQKQLENVKMLLRKMKATFLHFNNEISNQGGNMKIPDFKFTVNIMPIIRKIFSWK